MGIKRKKEENKRKEKDNLVTLDNGIVMVHHRIEKHMKTVMDSLLQENHWTFSVRTTLVHMNALQSKRLVKDCIK